MSDRDWGGQRQMGAGGEGESTGEKGNLNGVFYARYS